MSKSKAGKKALPDENARQSIKTDLDCCMLVEAGAGSGKTTSMVDRMVELLATGKAEADGLAAVTFTRKAAAHLRAKFQIALEKQIREEEDAARNSRLRLALSRMERCFIGTIHSFCGRLLRERPVEAGVDPNFLELEEMEDTVLARQSFLAHVQALHLQEASPVLDALAEIDVEPGHLFQAYRAIAGNPEVEVRTKRGQAPDFRPALEAVNGFLDRFRDGVPKEMPEGGWCPLQAVIRRAWRLCEHLKPSQPSRSVALLAAFDRSAKVTLKKWPGKELGAEAQESFETLKEQSILPALMAWREYCHPAFMDLIVPAAARYREQRWRQGRLNFQDLLLTAAELLRRNPEVRAYLQQRFTHLLIDEFQDTDPVQAEVMFYLAGEDFREQDWKKLRPRPGSLFVVGDPKQSIYRFRRADVETYNLVKDLIVQSGGKVVELQTNFRSSGKICDWVNEVFQHTFPVQRKPEQAAFAEMKTFRPLGGDHSGIRRITLPKVNRHGSMLAAQVDAQRIAGWIRHALDAEWEIEEEKDGKAAARPALAKDFLIVCPQRTALRVYAQELEKQRIPFEITGGGAFDESEELRALLAFLKCVEDPQDAVSLVAFLRGPFCGASDESLFRFKTAGGAFNYLVPVPSGLGAEAKKEIELGIELLRKARDLVHRLPPAAAFDAIIASLGLLPDSLAKSLGETRAGNLLKAVEFARKRAAEGDSFGLIVDFLSAVLEEDAEDYRIEEMSVTPGQPNAVRLMNLHQVKGLEAPVVFLADPLHFAKHPPTLHIDRSTEPPRGSYVVSLREEFRSRTLGLPPDWDELELEETQYVEAERERQLYVAATRAQNLLVISAYPEKSGPKEAFWNVFLPFMEEVKELEAFGPAAIEGQPKGEKPGPRMEDLLAARESLEKRLSDSASPTYRVESVTKLTKSGEAARIERADTGKGMSWGRVIHRALEAYARDAVSDAGRLIENLLLEEGRPLSEKEEVLRTVDGVIESPLWARMKRSKRRLVEVPFGTLANPAKLGLSGGPSETVLAGVLDLVFEEADGWVIVDFKTDDVSAGMAPLVALYRLQVSLYREHWEKLSGGRVKEAGLYFISAREFVKV